MAPPSPITKLGRTNWRNDRRVFGIRRNDRRHHLYIVGQTGTGKTTLLTNLMVQDLARGEGFAVLDPHGDLAARIALAAHSTRGGDVVVVDPADPSSRVRFNPVAAVPADQRTIAVASFLEALEKLFSSAWGARLEHILRNTLHTLVEQPNATLADVPRLYSDDQFRAACVERISNTEVRRFWETEYGVWTPRMRVEATGPILNKVGAFLADPLVRRLLVEPGDVLDVRRAMDEGKVLVVNLAKGRLGATNAALLGALILSRIEVAALERVDTPEEERRDFWVYLDEFQNFMTLGLASMLSELRKYRVGLTLAHQFVGQLTEEVRRAIFGNAGTIIAFRIGIDDAKYLETLFAPAFDRSDLANLPNFQTYMRLMVEGMVTPPFSADTLPVERAG